MMVDAKNDGTNEGALWGLGSRPVRRPSWSS